MEIYSLAAATSLRDIEIDRFFHCGRLLLKPINLKIRRGPRFWGFRKRLLHTYPIFGRTLIGGTERTLLASQIGMCFPSLRS